MVVVDNFSFKTTQITIINKYINFSNIIINSPLEGKNIN